MFHEYHMHVARAGEGSLTGPPGDSTSGSNPIDFTEMTGTPFSIPSDPNDNNGPKTLAVKWSLLALAFIFLSLRLWSKFRRQRGLWWDDHALAASWVS